MKSVGYEVGSSKCSIERGQMFLTNNSRKCDPNFIGLVSFERQMPCEWNVNETKLNKNPWTETALLSPMCFLLEFRDFCFIISFKRQMEFELYFG